MPPWEAFAGGLRLLEWTQAKSEGHGERKVAGLTEEPLGLPDVDGADSLLERLDGGAVAAAA
jgi:hypothetical protein